MGEIVIDTETSGLDPLAIARGSTLSSTLVYTFWDNQGTPSIMTMWAALAE